MYPCPRYVSFLPFLMLPENQKYIQSSPSTPSQDPVTLVLWKRDILDFHFLLITWFPGGREEEMVVAHRIDNSHRV